jgi:hypothetical protein
MTQELVLGILLAGLVGLVWAMTVSVLWTDQSVRRAQDGEVSTEQQDSIDLDKAAPKRQRAAA